MREAEPLPNARYAVFRCADVDDEGIAYYKSMAVARRNLAKVVLASFRFSTYPSR